VIAGIVVAVVIGALGIFIAALPPLAAATVITGFVLLIIGCVLGLLIGIRRSEPPSTAEGAPIPATRRIRQSVYGSRSADSDRMSSALRAKNLVPGGALLGPDPGPFDSPPEEDADLDPEHLPWELRDGSDADQPKQ
jgi:hypothetical protein